MSCVLAFTRLQVFNKVAVTPFVADDVFSIFLHNFDVHFKLCGAFLKTYFL